MCARAPVRFTAHARCSEAYPEEPELKVKKLRRQENKKLMVDCYLELERHLFVEYFVEGRDISETRMNMQK